MRTLIRNSVLEDNCGDMKEESIRDDHSEDKA